MSNHDPYSDSCAWLTNTHKIEDRNLGQELVTSAMDRMKVLGVGRLCF
jgi:hypothetical protein